MKKHYLLSIAIAFLTAQTSFSQLSAVSYTSDDFAAFKASKTYIVKTGDTKFDDELASAMKDLWTITPFESVDKSAFENKISDKSASFIVSIIIAGDHPNQNYHYLGIINGGRKKISRYSYDDMIAYCPINHFQDEPNNTDCAFRVRNMVESMISAMSIVQKQDIKGGSKGIVDKLEEYYNKRAPQIKKRTLLFCKESIGDKITQSDIAGIYPYKFEICDKAKLAQVIKDKSTDYYYFQPGITMNKNMFVFDPSNGDVLYADYSIMGLNISTGNIKDLAKAVKGGK
jgi:hypothetical protein